MTFVLPCALRTSEDKKALQLLGDYFAIDERQPLGVAYSGARFDTWDSTGSRADDADRFTADDLVAVSLLSVRVSPHAAGALLDRRADEFNMLLTNVKTGLDLVDVDPGAIKKDWPAWELHDRLRTLRDVDWVIAGKLIARKRPRIVPIYDRVVRSVTGGDPVFWPSLCRELGRDARALHRRLLRLRSQAKLSDSVSALRIFDVIAWMEGRERGF